MLRSSSEIKLVCKRKALTRRRTDFVVEDHCNLQLNCFQFVLLNCQMLSRGKKNPGVYSIDFTLFHDNVRERSNRQMLSGLSWKNYTAGIYSFIYFSFVNLRYFCSFQHM